MYTNSVSTEVAFIGKQYGELGCECNRFSTLGLDLSNNGDSKKTCPSVLKTIYKHILISSFSIMKRIESDTSDYLR